LKLVKEKVGSQSIIQGRQFVKCGHQQIIIWIDHREKGGRRKGEKNTVRKRIYRDFIFSSFFFEIENK